MHLKNRIERLEQADSKTCVLTNIPSGCETWTEVQKRFDQEVAANPTALAFCVRFVEPEPFSCP